MRARGTEDRPAREQREQAIAVAEIDLRSQPPADQMIHREDRTLVQRRVFIEQEVLVPPKSDQDRRFRRENKRKQAPAPRGFRFHRDRLLFSRKDSKWGPGRPRRPGHKVRLNEMLASTSVITINITRKVRSPVTAFRSAPLNKIDLIALTECVSGL